jgi:hypothetical protein
MSTLLRKPGAETTLKLYNVMAVPMLLYGSECWTINYKPVKQIHAAEIKFLAPVTGYRRFDQIH